MAPPRPSLQLEDFLPYRLSLTSNVVSQVIATSYEERYHLRTAEWRVMAVLGESEGLTQQDLVGRTKMDKVTVSRAAQVLERRRLVRRKPDPADARSLRLSLTPEGRALYDSVVPVARALEAELLEGLSPKEVSALKDGLRRLEEAAARVLARL